MATLLLDTFTDADGTALTAHTPETGGPWVAGVGTFKIASNKATPNSDADDDQAVIDAGKSDLTLTCDVVPTGIFATYNRACSLMWRWQDSNHFYLLDINVFGITANSLQLYVKNGSYTALVGANPVLITGSAYGVKVEVQGQVVNVYLSGVLQFSYNAASLYTTATKCGLRLGSGSALGGHANCTWDNFQVTAPDSSSILTPGVTFSPIPGSPNFRFPPSPLPSKGALPVTALPVPAILPGLVLGPPMPGTPFFRIVPPPPAILGSPAPANAGREIVRGVLIGPPMIGSPFFRTPPAPPPGPPPTKPPAPPGGPSHNLDLIERVPEGSDPRRLARHADKTSALLKSLIRQGVLVKTSAGEWKLVAPSGPPTPTSGFTGTG